MIKLEILNSKEKKRIVELINKRFSSDFKTDKAIIKIKDKLFLINRDVDELDFERLRIEKLGLYFASLNSKFKKKEDKVRLSFEGSQIIGETAKKNILNVNEEEIKRWLSGEDLIVRGGVKNCETGFVIIKFKEDFFGCGLLKMRRLEEKPEQSFQPNQRPKELDSSIYEVKNYIPKERRLKSFLMRTTRED